MSNPELSLEELELFVSFLDDSIALQRTWPLSPDNSDLSPEEIQNMRNWLIDSFNNAMKYFEKLIAELKDNPLNFTSYLGKTRFFYIEHLNTITEALAMSLEEACTPDDSGELSCVYVLPRLKEVHQKVIRLKYQFFQDTRATN